MPTSPDKAIFDSLITALQDLLQTDREYALGILAPMGTSDIDEMRTLHAWVLCLDHNVCATPAAMYLARGGEVFTTNCGKQLAGCRLIEVHAHRWTEAELFAIESQVLLCWPVHEMRRNRSFSNRLEVCRGNHRGYLQMVLLRSFPFKRLSIAGKRRLEEWERKFASVDFLYDRPSRQTPLDIGVIVNWTPERFLQAILAHQKRAPKSWRHWDGGDCKITPLIKGAVAQRTAEFIRYLSLCNSATPNAFIEAVDDGFMNLQIDSELAMEAARQFHRLGPQWSWRTLRLLEKVMAGARLREAFWLAFEYAKNGEGVKSHSLGEEGKRGEHLHGMAINSARGKAIGVLRQMLWSDPDLVSELKPFLPPMMCDPCAAIRTELASLCYAIAFKEENWRFAVELFVALITERLPDEHVLVSYWPFKFMLASIVNEWSQLRPTVAGMIKSSSSEVRSGSARLICKALVSGVDALELAESAIQSTDPKVRAAFAEVLSHNLDGDFRRPWRMEMLLKLADDSDKEVRTATCYGLSRREKVDFGPLSDFLISYAKTRAFLHAAGRFVDALEDSRSVLPTVVFDIVEILLKRVDEPVDEGADRLIWHMERVSDVLIRLYHENRDSQLRKRALDLIDSLCLRGSLKHEALDQ